MPSQPTAAQTRIDTLLTDMAQNYGLEIRGNYISDIGATHYRSDVRSNKYLISNKGDLRRSVMQVRATGKRAKRAGLAMSNDLFHCDQYAVATELADEDRTEAMIDVEAVKTQWLMHQAKLKQELLWAAACFVSGVWSGFADQTGVASSPSTNQFDQWDDYTNSTPLRDIVAKVDALRLSYGGKPPQEVKLVGVCGPAVWVQLLNHPDFVDRIKYTSSGVVTTELVAQLLGLDKFAVGQVAENTAAEGVTTTMADVFGKSLWLGYVSDTPNIQTATAATMFHWSPYDQVTEDGAEIRTWREEAEHQDVYEAQIAIDVKVTAADLGGIFLSAVA